MVEGKVISIGNVAYVLGISSKKLHRWYQDSLSGYTQALDSGSIGCNDLLIKEKGEQTNIVVPICKPKNLGSHMAIDEKSINGTCYTVLSNRDSNKIALMADSLKVRHLVELMKNFKIEDKMKVISITRDMASNYDWFGRQVFANAYHVIDKFHVLKNALDNMQAIRIRFRQKELASRRLAKESKGNITYQEVLYKNGDTTLQLLARSRGLLFKNKHEWSVHQKQRAAILFDIYPEISQAYQQVTILRKWYTPPKGITTYTSTRNKKEQQLKQIVDELNSSDIYEMKNLAHTLKSHSQHILSYFYKKETNAKAEALNQNMQRFINVNYGARNSTFFLFRLANYFS